MIAGTQECSRGNIPHGERRDTQRVAGFVRVMLAGGSRLLQDSLVHLLDNRRFSVEACVADLDEAIRVLRESDDPFDLLIVQLLGFSDIDFFDDLIRLRRQAGRSRLVLLAWSEKDVTFRAGCVEAGADAYLDASLSQAGLCQSLERVIAGSRVLPPTSSTPVRGEPGPGCVESGAGSLSPREVEILRHLANGEPNKVIAKALGITEATVKVHVKCVLRKTGARNRTSAAIWAIQNGLTPTARKAGA